MKDFLQPVMILVCLSVFVIIWALSGFCVLILALVFSWLWSLCQRAGPLVVVRMQNQQVESDQQHPKY